MIGSPKRKAHRGAPSDEFYPYYAGFPGTFARDLLQSANLKQGDLVFDPWNGSGTTTFAAKMLGYRSYGLDLNPVMVIVAKARLIETEETASLLEYASNLVANLRPTRALESRPDPLSNWFDEKSTVLIRSLERRIYKRTCKKNTEKTADWTAGLPPITCGLYVALFSSCRELIKLFKTSNPTWLRPPKESSHKLTITAAQLSKLFTGHVKNLTASLTPFCDYRAAGDHRIEVGDTTKLSQINIADFILTSPPYCTRIDYTAATRVELDILHPLLTISSSDLSSEMLGSIKVPKSIQPPEDIWGTTCLSFLEKLMKHPSKASSGYYFKTHVDYFDKICRSMTNIHRSLKQGGTAILVVQDSYYKDLHNDVPTIITEMAEYAGLKLARKVDFKIKNTFAGLNPRSMKYRNSGEATESVLCYQK